MKKILPLIALFGALACPAFGQYSLGKIGPGDVPCAYVSCAVSTLTALGLSTTVATSQSQASGGSTLLAFATTAGLSTGRVVSGTSIPLGDTIASIVSTAEVTRATTSGSSSGQKLVNFTSTTGFGVGQQCTDTTAPSAIGAGNVIASIQANVSITMTTNLTGNAGSGDTIVCDPVVTLTTTSSGTIAAAASILFIPNATSLSASSAIYDAGDLSVAGNMLGGRLSIGGAALGTDALAVTGTAAISSTLSLGGTIIDSNSGTSAFLGSIAMGAVTAANGAVYLYRGTDNANIEMYAAGQLGWSPNSNPTATVDLLMTRKGAASLQFGNVDAAAPVAQTLGVQSVIAGTSNTAGVVTTIRNSAGTGTGVGGNIVFQYAPHDTTHAVTTFTGSASPYTIGFTAGNITTYPIGTVMTVSGCTTATLNGTYTVTASSSGSVTATTSATGTGSPTTCLIVGNTSQNSWATALTINGDTALIQLQGTSASFPAIKRNGANIEARLADDSAQTAILAATFQTLAAGTFNWAGRSVLLSPADGTVELTNNAQTGFTSLQLGGTTASFPAIKRNATAINFRLADDSADASIVASGITGSGITTGTNADFACLAAGGVFTLQTSACTISSIRFKENIKPYTESSLAQVMKLGTYTYRLKATVPANKDPNARTLQLGLTAEDVAKIMPLCAIYENDMKTPKSYRQECLIAALVKTVQEQHAANDNLEHRVRALETTAARKRGMAP